MRTIRPAEAADGVHCTLWLVAVVCFGPLTLALSRRERPKSHRYFTIAMVAVGLLGLVSFNLYGGGVGELPDLSVGFFVYVVLPFAGAAWLLAKSWRFLLAPPCRFGLVPSRSVTRLPARSRSS